MNALVLLGALAALASAYHYEIEDGVYIATDDSLQNLIDTTDFILVEFFAPWCGHCKQLAPEYSKAAQQLKDLENVKLVKVDATIHTAVAEQFEVNGYPTIVWIKNGNANEYPGGRTTAEIVAFIRKKAGAPSTLINTEDELAELFKTNDAFAFGVFAGADNFEAAIFIEAATLGDHVAAHTFDASIAARHGLTAPAIVMFKKFDGGKTVYTGEYKTEDIIHFADVESFPLVNEFTDESSQKIFGGNIKNHVILFHRASDPNFAGLVEQLKGASAQHRGKFLFVTIDIDIEEHLRILDFFAIKPEDVPAVRLINLEEGMAKYKFDGAITTPSLNEFLQQYAAGTLKRHLNSEATPSDWDSKPVKVLTGENFNAVALNPDKHVFVEFYAPWCGHCKELAPTWDSLAEKLASHKDVIIAKIDGTANEVEGVDVQSYPTLKFFPKGADKTAVDYDGARDLAALTAFVHEHAGTGKGKKSKTGDHDEF